MDEKKQHTPWKNSIVTLFNKSCDIVRYVKRIISELTIEDIPLSLWTNAYQLVKHQKREIREESISDAFFHLNNFRAPQPAFWPPSDCLWPPSQDRYLTDMFLLPSDCHSGTATDCNGETAIWPPWQEPLLMAMVRLSFDRVLTIFTPPLIGS